MKYKFKDETLYVGKVNIGSYHWNCLLSKKASEEEKTRKRYAVSFNIPIKLLNQYAPSPEKAQEMLLAGFNEFLDRLLFNNDGATVILK